MEANHPLILVAVTTLLALAGGLRHGLSSAALPPAAGKALECVGAGLLFLAANIALGLLFSLGARAAGVFVSLYVGADLSLVMLSALQALVFLWWREGSGR